MSALLDVILPVFLIIGFGYVAARRGLVSDTAVDALMRYAQNFALPLLLFQNVATLDLGSAFAPPLLLSFYIGAFSGFAFGFLMARFVFHRALRTRWPLPSPARSRTRCCLACRLPNAPMGPTRWPGTLPSSASMRR